MQPQIKLDMIGVKIRINIRDWTRIDIVVLVYLYSLNVYFVINVRLRQANALFSLSAAAL